VSDRLTDRDLAMLDVPGIADDVRMMARELIERRKDEAAKFTEAGVGVGNEDGRIRRAFLTGREMETLQSWRAGLVYEHGRMAVEPLTAILDKITGVAKL
jgi:hypothetical protein